MPGISQELVLPILKKMATPPEFVLPPATIAHTRHFMPWYKKGMDDRTLVFDTFVVVSRDAELVVEWPGQTLELEEQAILAEILRNMNVLGRAESWCEARLIEPQEASRLANGRVFVSKPLVPGTSPGPDDELVWLLCADPDTAFDPARLGFGKGTRNTGTKTRRKSARLEAKYDPPWPLCIETGDMHAERMSDPPGSRWVQYLRPRRCFEVQPRKGARPVKASAQSNVQIVRFALDSTVLPLVTETLPVAEAARRALLWWHGQLGPGAHSATFSGKTQSGDPVQGHQHAYYLPTDEDGDGRLDHLTVLALGGFTALELAALGALCMLWSGREAESRHPLRLVLIGMGSLAEFRPSLVGPANTWVSVTPYIATRYAKTRGRNAIELRDPGQRIAFLVEDLRRQLAQATHFGQLAKLAHVLQIEPLVDANCVFRLCGRWRPIQFKRNRAKPDDDGARRLAGAFRLIFPEPVMGPIVLGHSAHFGMGLFMPHPGQA